MCPLRLLGVIAAVFLIPSVTVPAADDGKCIPVKRLKEENLAFKGGEELVFTIHYRWGSSTPTWRRQP